MKTEIVAKRFGRNLVVVINGEKKTRVINTEKDKKDEELIKNKITLYNKKNNKLLLDDIMYLVDTAKREKEEVEAKTKGIKKAIKKTVKKETKKTEKQIVKTATQLIEEIENSVLDKDNISKLEDILRNAKINKKQTSTTPVNTKTPKPGEW